MIRKAAIDIGTNTTRLLIADLAHDGTFTEIFCRRIITRLGEGLYNYNHLNDTAVQRTLNALIIYSKDIKKYKCSNVRAVATSAVREAGNGEEFVRKAKRETGLHIEVINQEEEALLAVLGVLSGLREKPETAIIFDVGGGSTEFICIDTHANP
ncbi:MAG: exopolyphosphatase, partial [Nitrospinota bacterium]